MRSGVSYSCTNCSKRKVKCDRKKPQCTSCQRNQIPIHLCKYGSPQTANKNKTKQQPGSNQLSNQSENSTKSVTENDKIGIDCPYNLQNFIFYNPSLDTISYYGATSWRTILKESFQYHPIVTESAKKSIIDINKWYKNLPIKDSVTYDLEGLLPGYKAISKILSNFLQQDNELIFKCFTSSSLFKYFDNTFDRKGKLKLNHSEIELCAILSVITLSCYVNNEFSIDTSSLYEIVKTIYKKCKFNITIAELHAMVLMFELRKYDYSEDFHYVQQHDIRLLSSITITASCLGLHRHMEDTHKGDWAYLTSLRNIWKYILFEDTVRSFRYGHSPFLNTDYNENELIDDDIFNYKARVNIMRSICGRVNSYQNSKHIYLNNEIHLAKTLIVGRSIPNYIDLSLIQCLVQIRYIKSPSSENLIELFETSLVLYKACKEVLKRGKTSHFLHAKESLFRASYAFLYILLEQNKERSNLQHEGKIIDIDWFFNFFCNDYQPLLIQIQKYNEAIRLAIISNVTSLKLIKETMNPGSPFSHTMNSGFFNDDKIFHNNEVCEKESFLDFL